MRAQGCLKVFSQGNWDVSQRAPHRIKRFICDLHGYRSGSKPLETILPRQSVGFRDQAQNMRPVCKGVYPPSYPTFAYLQELEQTALCSQSSDSLSKTLILMSSSLPMKICETGPVYQRHSLNAQFGKLKGLAPAWAQFWEDPLGCPTSWRGQSQDCVCASDHVADRKGRSWARLRFLWQALMGTTEVLVKTSIIHLKWPKGPLHGPKGPMLH